MAAETKSTSKINLEKILIVACAVLLLAVIIVSALGYTWHRDMVAAQKRAATMQMEVSSIESLTNEISNLQMENAQLNAELEEANRKLNASEGD